MANNTFIRDYESLKRRQVAVCKAVKLIEKAFEIAEDVVNEKNGKALNKRLATLIDERLHKELGEKSISCSFYRKDWSNGYELQFYLYNRSYRDAPESASEGTWAYFDSELYLRIDIEENGVIDAEEIIKGLKSRLLWNERVSYKYIDAVKNYTKHRAKFAKALETFQKTCGELNPMLIQSEVYTTNRIYPHGTAWEEKRDSILK